MKLIGMILIVLSTTAVGVLISINQRKRFEIFNELSLLCNELIIELEYRSSPILDIIENKAQKYKNLSFITNDNITNQVETCTSLKTDENTKINEFLQSLGKSDLNSQIKQIKAFEKEFDNKKNYYFEQFNKYRKINLSFGFFIGITFCLVIA